MRKVEFVAFHSPLFVPKIGNVGDSLPSKHKSNFELWGDESGIKFKTGNIEGFIPATQCKIWIYSEPDKTPVEDKVAKAAKGKG